MQRPSKGNTYHAVMYLFPQEYRESLSVEVFTSYQYLASGSCLIHANRFMGLWPLKTFKRRHKVSILSNFPSEFYQTSSRAVIVEKGETFFEQKVGFIGISDFPSSQRNAEYISARPVLNKLEI